MSVNSDNLADYYEATILSAADYYPFGQEMSGRQYNSGAYRYRYNGKELDTDFGLGWYAYGARWYEAGIGRFIGVDPIADQFPHLI